LLAAVAALDAGSKGTAAAGSTAATAAGSTSAGLAVVAPAAAVAARLLVLA